MEDKTKLGQNVFWAVLIISFFLSSILVFAVPGMKGSAELTKALGSIAIFSAAVCIWFCAVLINSYKNSEAIWWMPSGASLLAFWACAIAIVGIVYLFTSDHDSGNSNAMLYLAFGATIVGLLSAFVNYSSYQANYAVPKLKEPAWGEVVRDSKVTLYWSSTPEKAKGVRYILQLSKTMDFEQIVFENSSISWKSLINVCIVSNLLAGNEYYWRVRLITPERSSEWSDPSMFKVEEKEP